MAGKYLRTPARKPKEKPAETTNTQQSTTTNQQPSQMAENINDKPIEEQHKEFRKAAEETVTKDTPANEPVLDTTFKKQAASAAETAHPFETPTIERDYTDAGVKQKPRQTSTPPPSSQQQAANSQQQPPVDTFEPTPPPPEDDPNYADTHNPQDGPQAEGLGTMNIPRGSAEDLIEFGAKAINYLIGNFGGLLVGVKIRPEFHSIRDNQTSAAAIIKEFNDESVEKLKLDSEDIAMLTPPLVKLLQEKGIRGLTPGEELMLAVAMIAAKKVKVVMEIKAEGKRLEGRFADMIKHMRTQQAPQQSTTNEPTTTEEEIPLTPAEEA